MELFKIENLVDQRRPVSHILFAFISIAAVVVMTIKTGNTGSIATKISFFLLLFIQLEVFILIAGRIFNKMPAGLPSRDFTWMMLARLALFMVACFIAALVIFLIYKLFVVWIEGRDLSTVMRDFRRNEFSDWFGSTMKGLSIGAVIFVYLQWQEALKREQKLREETLLFQNETLRSQVNPHFLFNSLNTLSSLILTRPEIAEMFTIKLASIYRYILENSTKPKVTLVSEIAFINDYFELHRIRDEEKIEISVDVPDAHKYEIIPVSLQILVENAIKHNAATRESPLVIKITLDDNHIIVRNNLQRMASQKQSTKIGLKNLSERVRLSYGEELMIEETVSEFIVKVPLIK
jgi:two-component system LytT family sensor kinase